MASLSFERWSMKSPICPAKDPRNGHLERRYHARRLEILRAAGREFRLRGFAETGMRDIAAAAALSPANLYNYFRGKHDILFFCQDNSLDRMITTLDNARRMRTSAAIKLRIVIVSHLRCVPDEVEGSTAHLLTTALPRRQKHYLVAKRDKYEAAHHPWRSELERAVVQPGRTANGGGNRGEICRLSDPRFAGQTWCSTTPFL